MLTVRSERADARADLARELHDSVGHSVTAAVLQASAARRVLTADPAFADDALRAIEEQGREALEELDRVLAVLRDEDGGTRPAPTLDDVDALLARTRAAGVQIAITRGGDFERVPAAVGREAYRVLQEALTNVMRHASGATATVSLAVGERSLDLSVDNGPGTAIQPGRTSGGNGLRGVRERLRALGRLADDERDRRRRLHAARGTAAESRAVSAAEPAPVRVLIADDDGLVRSGLRTILSIEPDIDVVGEASDGFEAVRRSAELDPDVVLMDVRMPNLDGIQATRRIVERSPTRPRVLVVTTFEHDDYVFDALRAGASGFVLKRVQPDELAQAIRIVATGESLVFPALTRALVERHNIQLPPGDRRAELVASLTEREAEILRLVARGLSNQEIADTLVVAVHTVKSHVAHVLGKLESRDRTQAVIVAYETGFIRPGE